MVPRWQAIGLGSRRGQWGHASHCVLVSLIQVFVG